MNKPHLFLDRDGVINTIEHGFANTIEDFYFDEGALEALAILAPLFKPIVVVTNQAGIGYGFMTKKQLEDIHIHMVSEVERAGGRIDRVYYCPGKTSDAPACRKPNTGMGLQAKEDFPNIDFNNSWMVGDQATDIEFGKRLNMKTVRITGTIQTPTLFEDIQSDFYHANLSEFARNIQSINKNN